MAPLRRGFLMPRGSSHTGRASSRQEVVSLERESLYKAATAALGTAATYLWGGWDGVLMALVVLVCIDYGTGVAAAWVGQRLSSQVGARGIARKIGIFLVVAVANVLDNTGGLGEPILRTVACWFYIANEALSIVENLGEVGVPIPDRLRQALAVLQDKYDGEVGR